MKAIKSAIISGAILLSVCSPYKAVSYVEKPEHPIPLRDNSDGRVIIEVLSEKEQEDIVQSLICYNTPAKIKESISENLNKIYTGIAVRMNGKKYKSIKIIKNKNECVNENCRVYINLYKNKNDRCEFIASLYLNKDVFINRDIISSSEDRYDNRCILYTHGFCIR